MTATLRTMFAAVLCCAALHASAQPMLKFFSDSSDPNYSAGTKALNDHRYIDAVNSFDKVTGEDQQGALYWKAYALKRLHRNDDAKATCTVLHTKFPKSSWNNDCGAIMVTIQRSGTDGSYVITSPPTVSVLPMNSATVVRVPRMHGEPNAVMYGFSDDSSALSGANSKRDPETEIKILALNSAIQENPEKAMPELRQLLGNKDVSVGMKSHVLFMLSQSKSPEAQKTLEDVIRGNMGPELQRSAVQTVPIFQGSKVNGALVDAYRNTSDLRVKKAVITGLFISQDAPHMVEIARSEKDLELKRQIVSQLAIMHDKAAQDYMLELLK